jgi:hypothetical protein
MLFRWKDDLVHDHTGDDELLHTFRQLGIDLAKPRELNFYFIVPTEADADSARSLLSKKQLTSEKLVLDLPWWKRLFAKPEWMVSVTRTMPLDEAQIKKLTTHFQQIARECHGRYDGWEANVMDDQIDPDKLQNL